MRIKIPEFALVVLIGPSGAGKSTFAHRHFLPTEVISSDACRAMVSDDENSMAATGDAFDLLHYIAAKRLQNMRLSVVDATSVQPRSRQPLVALARDYHCLPVAIVLDMPEALCRARNEVRPDRNFGPHVIRNHRRDLRRSLKRLRQEGFRYVYHLKSPEEVEAVEIERTRLWNDRRDDQGPFDIIGDIHGCATELEALLADLGYRQSEEGGPYRHPEGRRAIFLGDLMDRGPRNLDAFTLVRDMVTAGAALAVPGNHDAKLVRRLRHGKGKVTYGLEVTLGEIAALPDEQQAGVKEEMTTFLDGLVSHYVLDGGQLVVAHAGLTEALQGRASGRVREFALYGDTTGESDEYGLPIRRNWGAEYRGEAIVVYGHTPVGAPEWLNRTINIDTGCVFGGMLTALRYPELDLVQVPSRERYAESPKPFLPEEGAAEDVGAQARHDRLLHLDDVRGKRIISTRLQPNITIREANATAALEVMSRFAVDPRWLIYLPPTMSPTKTSTLEGTLEYPDDAFDYYQRAGQSRLVCEEKHMGSRAIVVLCRDPDSARRRFGVSSGDGVIYTRTGRPFFSDEGLGDAFLRRLRAAADAGDFWARHETEWMALDCEIMPWSQKAQGLLRDQYAALAAAARTAFPPALAALEAAAARGIEVDALVDHYRRRYETIDRYSAAYRHYCWPVDTLNDLRVAPFHLLATEGQAHVERSHEWHLSALAPLVDAGVPLLQPTAHRIVDLTDPASRQAATDWWLQMTAAGGEGMVVKPESFISRGGRGIVQPAIKVRGQEYLRIIYGPEYTLPDQLSRLRDRHLGRKRSLALREFALGVEALERFVAREPLRRTHECVFGVLALESEPVDPAL